MSRLTLVPIYLSDGNVLLSDLSARLARSLRTEVEVRPPWFDPEVSFDPSRGQYNSTALLALLLCGPGATLDRVLGIAGVDLFIPVLTFVFGEAQLRGAAAIVSVHRLRNEAYGLPADPLLLSERLEKEAVHEIGHTLGLVHCRETGCVMRSSTYVEEIDLKDAGFCPACAASIPTGIER